MLLNYMIHNECYMMNAITQIIDMNAIIYAWYIVNDEWYIMNGTWRMLNKHVIWWMLLYYTTHNTWWMLYITHDSQRMMNDTWWVCYVTTHDTMNYNCNNAQGHMNTIITTRTFTTASVRTITYFWLISPLAHTAKQVITKQCGRACFCRLMPPHIWSGRRPWRYGRKRWREMKRWLGTHAH
jgi:hypothetical protein